MDKLPWLRVQVRFENNVILELNMKLFNFGKKFLTFGIFFFFFFFLGLFVRLLLLLKLDGLHALGEDSLDPQPDHHPAKPV